MRRKRIQPGISEEELEEKRLEIENRIRNLFWTVTGDYSMDIAPDAETFTRSKALALYDAIKQGGFARHFDKDALAFYLLKKRAMGADEQALMDIAQLCIDTAAYPLIQQERVGVEEIRKQAFSDFIQTELICFTPIARIRREIMNRFLGRESECPAELLHYADEIEAFCGNTDEIIAEIDSLYNRLADPAFEQKKGNLKRVLDLTVQDLFDYERSLEITDEQMDKVMEEYLAVLKEEMLRMKELKPLKTRRYAPTVQPEGEETPIDPEAAGKVLAYMERNFGKSYLTELERYRRCRALCRGIHAKCTLYYTDGILQSPALKNTQFLRGRMQQTKNELYFSGKQRSIRRNVSVLAAMLKQVQIMRQDEDNSRANYGQVVPSRLWKIGRTEDDKLFDITHKRENTRFVVDILMDGSSSQILRQPQIATQGYIISQALSEAGIPHRVSSFCTFWDYTILHRFRDYDDPAESNKNILQFHALGENRDGLAIRAAVSDLVQRDEENKLLIILSDGRPNDLGTTRPGSQRPAPYVGEEAVKDTAFEVRKARNLGISVLGIFVGSEEDLYAEKKIFGRDFAYSRNISSFSHIVGTYLRRQLEQE